MRISQDIYIRHSVAIAFYKLPKPLKDYFSKADPHHFIFRNNQQDKIKLIICKDYFMEVKPKNKIVQRYFNKLNNLMNETCTSKLELY